MSDLMNHVVNKVKGEVMSDKDNEYEVIETVLKFPKKDVSVILEEAKEINPDKVAEEVLMWLEANVENYIDNHAKVFEIPIDNLDVQVSDSEKQIDMSETIKLQNLYRAIPDDDSVVSLEDFNEYVKDIGQNLTGEQNEVLDSLCDCREVLNKITEDAFEKMQGKDDLRAKLAERMMFFYELMGFQDGKAIVQKMKGIVRVESFDYDSFSIGVRIREGKVDPETNEEVSERKVVKEYIIPEGFNCRIELSCKADSRPSVLF